MSSLKPFRSRSPLSVIGVTSAVTIPLRSPSLSLLTPMASHLV
ncbi:MAG: hypothetical protein QXI22_03950 [Sulfolobales archaeon]